MRFSRFVIAALLLTAGSELGAVPPLPVQAPPLPGPPLGAPPLPAGAAPDLDLVFTAQVAGWIEPCG